MASNIQILKGMFSAQDPIEKFESRLSKFVSTMNELTGESSSEDYSSRQKGTEEAEHSNEKQNVD